MLFDNERNEWVSDVATLGIEYQGEQIAYCELDLTKYLDQGARTEKVMMSSQQDNSGKLKLFGDSEAYPDAHILFRIFVDSINDGQQDGPTSADGETPKLGGKNQSPSTT